jgi:tetratricopeptide (TPR) repeat protein
MWKQVKQGQKVEVSFNPRERFLAQLDSGQYAVRYTLDDLERQVARGVVVNLGWDYHSLGRACLLLGRLDEARRLALRAVESSPSQPGYAAWALHLSGDSEAPPDRLDAERGETRYRQALALAERLGMRPLAAHCHLGLATLYRRTGKREQAREHLTTATAMYHEMNMSFWLKQAKAEMSELA